MTCSSCAHENPAGAKFCEECGNALGRACASCGLELRVGVKFCSECGTAVASSGAGSSAPVAGSQRPPSAAPSAPSGGTRKIVTIVFADLVGSTALHERLDPESARRFMESYYDAMRDAVESHGGTVTQLLGDGVKAVFGIPRVAEDDAIRAVRAAVAMQQSFRALAEQQRGAVGRTGLRVAVNTGEVVANDEAEIIGDPVNVAARLQEQGADGDVVVGDSTARLVEALVTLAPLGSFALKGRAEEVAAFKVESLDPPSSAVAAAFVGRDDEIARISSLYEKAVEKPATTLAVLLGSPGLGKSRLIDEFARRLGDTASVVEAHCDEASVASFAPLALALRELLDVDADASEEALRDATKAAIPADNAERERIAKGIGALLAGSPTSPEETFFVVRRLFSALASRRPLVLVIDDLQWAEPLLLDLVEHLVEWGSGVPLLVVVGARPELRDKRSSLTTPGGLVGDVVTLAGLDAGAAMRLAANVIGATDLPAVVAAKVLATSEGNPLFVGELVRMLVHEGALTREGDRWTTGTALAALEMPPTIHALLAARIERLHPDERIVLERAAVVGRHFSRSAVAELLPGDVADLDVWLESLGRSELIERDTGWFLGEPVLRFHHVLIRDAAYRQLLKGTRAELHIRFADWVKARAGDTIEHDETIGWHLEQAHQFLRELGPLDATGRSVGERASTHLAAAGRRALARDDVQLAASLLGRAIARLDPDDPARAELALDWCEALLAAGDVGPAVGAIEQLDRAVGDSDRLRAWHICLVGQHTVLTAPEGLQGTADSVAEAAASLASQADDAGEAKAHYVYALALQRLGKIGACEAALDRALAAARRVEGDRRRANTVLAIAPLAALWGPSPVTRASGRCLDVVRVLRITQGAPAVEAVALSCQGVLEALRGRTDAARRMIASARKMVEELGITQRLLEVDVFGGLVDLLEGDAPAAERKLRAAYEGMRELGLGIAAARAAAQLARALLAQDRVSEAEALSHESEALAGDDLKAAIAWRGVRAEALARRGEHASAVAFASKAVEMAAATDALLDHADARLALAAALRAGGRGPEADAEERRASELWEAKGATLLAERARREGARLAPVAASGEEFAAQNPALRRRVRANAATAALSRLEAAVASRDFEAVRALFSDSHVMIERPTGASFGPDAGIASLERLFRSRDAYYEIRPLATLGESLVLTRRRSGAAGAVSRSYDVGAYENDVLHAQEVDEQGLIGRSEVFADDRLKDAIVWLYERYGEWLPEGPARTRAATTARFLAAFNGAPNYSEELEGLLAPDLEATDHRHLRLWSARGADAFLEHHRALHEVADNVSFVTQEILALEPDALLTRVMHSGTERQGGGSYERPFLSLFTFDAAGRLARIEWFDADREAEALARFDTLTAPREAPRSPSRRIPSTRATAYQARMSAAIEARDAAAIAADLSEDFELVHHATGASYRQRPFVEQWQAGFRAERFERRTELLGALGDSLALGREWNSLSGLTERDFESFGPSEIYDVFLVETDEQGRCERIDIFAPERLGNAIAHLYGRFAARLSEGDEGTRAAATASSVAALLGPPDLAVWATTWAPDIEMVDHCILGFESLRGVDSLRAYFGAMFELEDFALAIDDILRLQPDALLLRVTTSGTARAGGGAYERPLLQLWIFGSDGRLARFEYFEAEREVEALARFDALTQAAAGEARFSNTATGALERIVASWTDRDWERFEQNFAPDFVHSSRRRMLQLDLDRDRYVAFLREVGDMDAARLESAVLATRGDMLVLARMRADVAEGDVGPSEIVHLNVIETDARGVVIAWVQFDLDDLAAAYAELDARYDAGEAAAHRQNWESIRRFVQGIADRDWDAVAALCAPELVEYDHRSLAVLGTTRGAAAWVDNFRVLVELASDTAYRAHHWLPQARGYYVQGEWYGEREGGAYEIPLTAVLELDERGLIIRADIYDDGVDAALARLAELAEPAAAPSPFANAATRASERNIAAWLDKDWDRFAQLFPADFHLSDRRRAVQLELDREGTIAFSRTLGELATTGIAAEILATRGERLALLRWHIEVAGDEVGPSELVHLNLFEADENGALKAVVRWDSDELAAARAELDTRFAALGSGREQDPAAPVAKPNAMMAAMDRWLAAYDVGFNTGEWDTVRSVCAEDFVFADRRRLALLEGDRELMIASARERAASGARPQLRLLGTAGDRVAAWQLVWAGGPSDGRFEIEYICVGEIDESGLLCAFVLVDAEDTLVAKREAWARWGASDPAVAAVLTPLDEAMAAFNEKDPARWHAAFAEDVVVHDHRLAGMGRIEGPDAYTDSILALWEIAPVTSGEFGWDFPAFDHYGAISVLRRTGTVPDGGDFESEYLYLHTVAQGRVTRVEMFELHALDQALARFAALNPHPLRASLNAATRSDERLDSAGTSASQPFANAASRGLEQSMLAWQRRDAAEFAACYPPAFRYRDHRRLLQLDLDREEFLEFTRPLIEMASAGNASELLATRGERLALVRSTIEMEDDTVGPSAIDSLLVIETNEHGDIRTYERFDPEDLDAAYERLDAHWESGDAALQPEVSTWIAAFRQGFANRDWDAMAALAAPDQVAVNHRTVGWGTLSGPAAWVPALQALVGLAEDTRLRVDHLRVCERGFLWTSMWQGTRDGGKFETPWTMVGELDASGTERRMDVWDIEKLDLARARFQSFAEGAPLVSRAQRAKPNSASASMLRWAAAFDACVATGDWSALQSLYASHATFEDRQRVSQLSGDLALQLASMRERGEAGARPLATLVGTAGDRIAVMRMLWSGGPPDGRFEIEHLALVEVDVSGLFTATVLFEPGDLRAAQREAWARRAAIDPVAAPVAALLTELTDAWNARDRGRVRARFSDDLVVEDHRHAGLGRLEGADAYVDSNVVLWDLAPEQRIEFDSSWPAIALHGAVATLRREGTLPEGGAFESDYVFLYVVEEGLIARLELFEVDALEDALLRFEELRPDPLRIPPNAATRALDEIHARRESRDIESLRAVVTQDFCFDDRGRKSLVSGGVEEWLRALEFLWAEAGARIDSCPIAIAGDRLALDQNRWHESEDEGRFEIHNFRVTEVDASGKLRALVLFDSNDRAAAHAELFERYVASGADGMPPGVIDSICGWNEHDLVRLRSSLRDDFVLDDRRRTGLGRLEGADAYVESVAALQELIPDARIDFLYDAAAASQGRVIVSRTSGTNTEGGAVESLMVALMLYREEKLGRMEFFELEEFSAVLARFEELTSGGGK